MLQRYENNPIIRPEDVAPSAPGFQVVGAFNPGAVLFQEQVILLLRVAEKCLPVAGKVCVPVYRFENGTGIPEVKEFDLDDSDVVLKDTRGLVYKGQDYLSSMSHIRLARSSDGKNFTVDPKPFIFPCSQDEQYGIEDARAVVLEGRCYLNYSIVSQDSWCTALAVTDDFVHLERLGIIFHPENKDVAIFPRKINNKFAALHRPNNSGFGKPAIWYAESPDLIHWGRHQCIVHARDTDYEAMKIGGGSAPLETSEGWLCIYHAKGTNSRYSLFALLMDLEKPWEIIKRTETPLLEPAADYETNGFFPNVVFTNGIVQKDGQLFIYYGASDETSCLAVSSIDKILNSFN